jgi:predicted O-methyltransferase YrrM
MNAKTHGSLAGAEAGFSLSASILTEILTHARPLGHREDRKSLNLGFGFLYYGVVRVLMPKHVLVIGSGYGFSVVCLALGLKDNGAGRLTFVDPSYSILKHGPFKTVGGQGKWDRPEEVRRHFSRFGVEDIITHHKERSDAFFEGYDRNRLPEIDVAFIDGNHSHKAVCFDFDNVVKHAHKNTYVFLHDTNIYVREMIRHSGVKRLSKGILRQKEAFELIDFPLSSGVALVRVRRNKRWTDMEL